MSQPSPDVVIIGGGLHGLSSALHLALAGARALVIEKDYPGRHASGVNAGGVRRLGRHFAEVPLSVAAMGLWHRISDLVDDDCGFKACGQVKIAESAKEMESLRNRVTQLRRLGHEHEQLIDQETLRELVPNIAPHCVGAIHCPEDGAANPFRTVTAFRRRAEALGARVLSGTEVQSIERAANLWQVHCTSGTHSAPTLVNAAGAWAGSVCAQLGEPVPIRAEAPMLMITERLRQFLKPVLGAAGRRLSFKQFENGTLMIGGGHLGSADPESNRNDVRLAGLRTSARTVTALFPQLRGVRVQRFWAGIEGVMPDAIPVIGPSSTAENAFHVFGFSAHGFQLAPITGRIVSELITRGLSTLDIDAFRIDRFHTDERVALPPLLDPRTVALR